MANLYFTGTCDVVVDATTTVATITPTVIYNEAGTVVSTLYGRLKAGDRFDCSAGHGIVAAVAADGTITTTIGWYGATATGAAFNAQPMPAGSELATSVRDGLAWKNTLNNMVCARAGASGAVAALQKMDCLIGMCFTSMALTAPPASFDAGVAYLVGTSATGDWLGRDGKIAYSRNGASWEFYAPYNGLMALNDADGLMYLYTSGNWVAFSTLLSLAGSVLASGKLLVGNANGAAAAVSVSGDITLDNAGAAAVKKIGGHAVSVSGDNGAGALYSLSVTLTGNSAVTFPASGTVAVRELAQTFLKAQNFAGRVTIGTESSAPEGLLAIRRGASLPGIEANTDNDKVDILSYNRGTSTYTPFLFRGSYLSFMPNDVEVMRITPTGVGIGTAPGYDLHIKKSNSPILQLEAQSGGAPYMRFVDTSGAYGGIQLMDGAGTVKWMIGNNGLGTGSLGIYGPSGAFWWYFNGGDFLPAGDALANLGDASHRLKNICAANSTIVTSWSARKARARPLTDNEVACAQKLADALCLYQFEDAIAEKGVDAARWHCGAIADTNTKFDDIDAVQTVCEKWGVDPLRMGFFCRDLITKEIAKTTTHKAQKTKTVTTTEEKIVTADDGTQVATTVEVTTSVPVYVTDSDGNDIWYGLTDSCGNVLKDADGNTRQYRKPVMEDVLDAGTDTVYVLSDGTTSTDSTNALVTYSYSLRYEELLCFIAAGAHQARVKSDAAIAELTERVAVLEGTTTTTASAA